MKYLLATSKKMEHNRSDGRKPQVDNHWPSVIVVALYFSKKGVFRANNSPASVTLGPFDPAVTVGRSIPSPFLLASCLSGFHAFSFLLEPARIAAHQAHTVFAFHASPNPAVMRRQQNCALQFRWQATAAHKPLFVHSACLNCCGASLFPPLIPLPWTNKKLLSHSSATFLLNITLLRCCALFIRWWLIVLPEPLWLFLTSMVAIAVMELKVFGKKFKYLIDGLLAFLSNSLVSHRRFACFSQQLPTVFCLMTNQHCSQIRYTCLITLNAVTSTASSICWLCFTCGRLGKISASPNVSLTYPGDSLYRGTTFPLTAPLHSIGLNRPNRSLWVCEGPCAAQSIHWPGAQHRPIVFKFSGRYFLFLWRCAAWRSNVCNWPHDTNSGTLGLLCLCFACI